MSGLRGPLSCLSQARFGIGYGAVGAAMVVMVIVAWLIERLVLSMTEEGDAVFDPYMGVGSSVIAAVKHGRKGYGCDVVHEYVNVAWDRLHQLRAGTLEMRPMARPVYDPAKPYGGHR